MAKIKEQAAIAAKWSRRAGSAGPEYEEGVRNPRADWATETAKSEPAYVKGIQAAIARKAFGKGVKDAGTSKWSLNALAKGPGRFVEGVGLATEAYEKGFAPYRSVIAGLTLPARGPKGDPSNLQRVAMIAKALHEKKIAGKG